LSPWWLRPSNDDNAQDKNSTDEPAKTESPPVQPEPEPAEEKPPVAQSAPRRDDWRSAAPRLQSNDREGADDDGDDADDGDDQESSASTSPRTSSRRRGRRGRGSRGGRGRSSDRSDAGPTSPTAEAEPTAAPSAPPPPRDKGRSHSFDASDLLFELASATEMIGPERSSSFADEAKIALFCDLENIALGVRDSKEVKKFDINLVLERLLEKGKIIVKKAYCDWDRYSEFKRPFHESAFEMIEIPQKRYSGKNSADIKMVVDAMDLSYSKEHLDTFVILSGDSDFSPLVSKLKENNKRVIGVGVKGASSKLLIGNCDEFIYYEDIWRSRGVAPTVEGLSPKSTEAFALMIDSIQALVRENKTVLWGSMIKQTMQRKNPSFNEGYYGYGSFSELLEDAATKKLINIKMDKRAGSYIVTGSARK